MSDILENYMRGNLKLDSISADDIP